MDDDRAWKIEQQRREQAEREAAERLAKDMKERIEREKARVDAVEKALEPVAYLAQGGSRPAPDLSPANHMKPAADTCKIVEVHSFDPVVHQQTAMAAKGDPTDLITPTLMMAGAVVSVGKDLIKETLQAIAERLPDKTKDLAREPPDPAAREKSDSERALDKRIEKMQAQFDRRFAEKPEAERAALQADLDKQFHEMRRRDAERLERDAPFRRR